MFVAALMLVTFTVSYAGNPEAQLKMRFIRTVNDTAIDSLSVPNHSRVYINSIFAWYDNAANTNVITLELVEGMTAMAVQGSGRIYKYSEAMTSAGIKALPLPQPINLITTADSTVYMSVSATGSDSLIVGYTYKFVQ